MHIPRYQQTKIAALMLLLTAFALLIGFRSHAFANGLNVEATAVDASAETEQKEKPRGEDVPVETCVAVGELDKCTLLPIVGRIFGWPETPTIESTEPDIDGEFTLSWSVDNPDYVTEYILEESQTEDFAFLRIAYRGAATTIILDNNNETRYYRVRAVNIYGQEGGTSEVLSPNSSRIFVDDNTLTTSQCTTLRWNFTGIAEFYINYAHGFDKRAAGGVDTAEICPSVDTTYEALVVLEDGTQQTFSVDVDVTGTGCNRDPYVQEFKPTAFSVPLNQRVTVTWDIQCASEIFYQIGEGPERGVNGVGSEEFRITGDTLFKMRVVKRDNGAKVFEDNASFTVTGE